MSLHCPRCGIPFHTRLSRSSTFSCLGCGAIFNDHNLLYSNVQKGMSRAIERHPFLQVGQQGKLNNETVILTARIRYRMQCEEWDEEDRFYRQEDWLYDE